MNRVFVSYSHYDLAWLEQLKIHLRPLVREGLDLWDDTRIQAGQQWREEIERAISSAHVGILLISAHFLASDFVLCDELPQLLAAAETKGTTILCVIISHSLFADTPILSRLQTVNSLDRPLIDLSPGERAACLVRLARQVKTLISTQRLDQHKASRREVGGEAVDAPKKPPATGNAPLNPESFIDPRMWNDDTSLPARPSGASLPKLAAGGNVTSLERLLEGAAKQTAKMPVPTLSTLASTAKEPAETAESRAPVLVVIAVLALVLNILLYMLVVRH